MATARLRLPFVGLRNLVNPYEPPEPDVERGLVKREAGENPARVLLYIVGGICICRGLSLIFNAYFELTLLAFGGTAIWLARQHFDTTVRLTTIGWSVSAFLLVLAVIAIDPPSTRDVARIGVAGVALLLVVAIATITFRRQPIKNIEQPPASNDEPPHSLGDISEANNVPVELTWWLFARWSLSLSLITILSSIVSGVAFFYLIVVPVGHYFDIRLARLAFSLPFFVAPGVWVYGMIRCHGRHPSKGLIISLGVTGVALYALLPVILYAVVMSFSGGWNVK